MMVTCQVCGWAIQATDPPAQWRPDLTGYEELGWCCATCIEHAAEIKERRIIHRQGETGDPTTKQPKGTP